MWCIKKRHLLKICQGLAEICESEMESFDRSPYFPSSAKHWLGMDIEKKERIMQNMVLCTYHLYTPLVTRIKFTITNLQHEHKHFMAPNMIQNMLRDGTAMSLIQHISTENKGSELSNILHQKLHKNKVNSGKVHTYSSCKFGKGAQTNTLLDFIDPHLLHDVAYDESG